MGDKNNTKKMETKCDMTIAFKIFSRIVENRLGNMEVNDMEEE